MPNAFPFSLSPFDCLDPDERRQVRGSVDIAYFPQQAVIADLPAGGYARFLCVEAASVGVPVQLAPGAHWQGSQCLVTAA